jgi:hypothetical protein
MVSNPSTSVKYDRAASTSRHGSTGIATRITIPSPYYAEKVLGLQPTVMVIVTGSAGARTSTCSRIGPEHIELGDFHQVRDQLKDQAVFGRQRNGPIRAWVEPKMRKLVPHTGFLTKRLMRLSRVTPVHV